MNLLYYFANKNSEASHKLKALILIDHPILEGILFGLGTIIFIGPVLFTLLNASIQHGFSGGLSVALGIIASDIIAATLCLLGLYKIFEKYISEFSLGIAGIIVLSALSIRFFFFPPADAEKKAKKSIKNLLEGFTYGFLVNFVNPFVFAVWLGTIAYATEKYGAESTSDFVISMIASIFFIDTTRAYFAVYLNKWLDPKHLKILFRVFAVILVAFVFRIIYHLWQL